MTSTFASRSMGAAGMAPRFKKRVSSPTGEKPCSSIAPKPPLSRLRRPGLQAQPVGAPVHVVLLRLGQLAVLDLVDVHGGGGPVIGRRIRDWLGEPAQIEVLERFQRRLDSLAGELAGLVGALERLGPDQRVGPAAYVEGVVGIARMVLLVEVGEPLHAR